MLLRPWRWSVTCVCLLTWTFGSWAAAQKPSSSDYPVAQPQAKPNYPHVDMATSYEVDPNWPQGRAEMAWDAVCAITVDPSDQIWVFVRANPPVRVFNPAGKLLRSWGNDCFDVAHGLRLDREGLVWVTDVRKHTLMKYTPDGKLLQTVGTPGEPGEDDRHFNKPADLAFASNGDIYVADGYGNNRVVHLDKNGKFIRAWGKLGTGQGEFSLPHSIAVDSQDRVYVGERNNARIQIFDRNGKHLAEWRNLICPWGLTMTSSDELWACGASPMGWRPEDSFLSCPPKDQLVLRLDTTGRVHQIWTFPLGVAGAEKPGELNWLHNAAVDSKGNLYVGDIKGQRVQKFVRKN